MPKNKNLIAYCGLYCGACLFYVGFLLAECEHAEIEIPEFTVIDTLALARRCYNFWSNSLGNIAEALGISVQEKHRATADVKITLEVFLRFIANFEWRGIRSLDQMLSLQAEPSRRRWKREFALPPHLDEAVRNKKPLPIKYVSAFGEKTERIVEPKEIVSERDYLYLVAHCRLRMAERNFRLDRIVEMRMHEE